MASMSLVSLNIERSKHLELVVPFLQKHEPDVVCLQELMERDVLRLEDALGARAAFAPMTIHPAEDMAGVMGVGIFSRLPIEETRTHIYYGKLGELALHDQTSEISRIQTTRFVVLVCDVRVGNDTFRITTTHLPKSEEGSKTADAQREAAQALLSALGPEGELVLCGDFNAPRGYEIFSTLSARYKDNVPPHYTTSIDGRIHRAGPLPYMVDGIFSTPAYTVSNVEMVSGVSDHCALVATVSKN